MNEKGLKRAVAFCMALMLAVTPATVSAGEKSVETAEARNVAYTLYVSPTGNDGNDGSQEKPFKTIEAAKEAVRKLDKSQGDIVVKIADGFYAPKDTLEFKTVDSGNDNCTIYYEAEEGAAPVVSGGKLLESEWQIADDITWDTEGTVYKAPLERNEKLRAIYVNGERANMTRKTGKPLRAVGEYRIEKGQADWAWTSGTRNTGNVFDDTFGLPADTRNQHNIELESRATYVTTVICADTLEQTAEGDTQVNFQMPYAAIAQNISYRASGINDVMNVFEWLDEPGEFYFDEEGSMLYYIPRNGENLAEAEVVIPELDTVLEICGDTPKKDYAEHLTFDGLTFAYSNWNLAELEGSYANTTSQGTIITTKYTEKGMHNNMYRGLDVPPAAVHVSSAKDIRVLDGEIRDTGCLGVHLENDVSQCEVTGNYIARTGGSGIVVGHPQHVFENDTEIHQVSTDLAGPEQEKFPCGTEAAPRNILLTNNYLYKNCHFFEGHAPIASFYTYNMQVLHNFIYQCSYSGMSIGWGWCEFDGTESSKLPGIPTTTSRNNHINYNRVEEVCSSLHDGGGIYSLGRQGNDDWTESSEMNNNYVNIKREPQKADGSRMVNGFHPDEGSAYIRFDSNVVTNIIRSVYELNDWKRKHDLHVTNGFSNTDRCETGAPNTSLSQYVNADYIWPQSGHDVVLHSGLEDEYTDMVGKDVIGDTEYELASNVALPKGINLNRRGLLSAEDEVWIAPEGTTQFTEGKTMTTAAGNEKTIQIPAIEGEYKLYVKYADGSVSEPSLYTIYVGEAAEIPGIVEAENYIDMSGIETVDGAVTAIHKNDWMEYNVKAAETENFDVSFTIASEEGKAADFDVFVDGKLVKAVILESTNSEWQTVKARLKLEKGIHKIKVVSRAEGWKLDKMEFTKASAETGHKVEAEDYTDKYGDVKKDGLGLGYISAGDWIEYKVNIPKTGTYKMVYRVAVNKTPGKIDVSANGISLGQVEFPGTGGWKNWTNVSQEVKFEKAGEQTIRMNVLASGWNFDYFTMASIVEETDADKAELQALYEECSMMEQENYADESWAVFMEARKAARNTLTDESASQEVVDAAVAAMKDAVANLEKNADDIEDIFTIAVNGEATEHKYNDAVTIEAPAEKDGKKFSCWMVGDEIVSYETVYKFYVSKSMKLTAVYTEEAAEAEPKAILTNVFVTKRADEKSDVKFVGELVIPEEYELVNAGLVWSSKEGTKLVLEGGLKPTYITKISDTNQFSVTIKGMPQGKFIRGSIFATITNGTETKVIYSAEKRAEAK